MSNSYYANHIAIYHKEAVRQTSHGARTDWECYLCGEHVGRIQYFANDRCNAKPYEIFVRHEDREWCFTNAIGHYSSLASAKAALLQPAREYLARASKAKNRKESPAIVLPEADREFYPTPPAVAGRMLAGIDWSKVDSVLEPSAGRGDLLEYADRMRKKKERYHNEDFARIVDCVEIDANLRALLIGKGFRVVHDDFLSFHTRKQYDLILMNPPFSEGDLHLLHALELCANGGQIVCVLNAETIRNPFTNRRKILAKELKRHGASIRFIENAFNQGARRACVDVALVTIKIPAANTDTSIWDDLQKARDATLDYQRLHEVAPANNIERLIREYDLLCEAGIVLMQKYNGIAPRIHNRADSEYSKPLIALKVNDHECHKYCTSDDINRFLRAARTRYWRELFDLPELRNQMTSAMRKEYHETIETMKDYEFSMFNVEQVLEKIRGQLIQGVEEAIISCFDKLSAEHTYHREVQNDNIHYYNGWKSNKAHFVNTKCVIPTYGCFAHEYKRDKWGHMKYTLEGLDVHTCFGVLDDLEKALDYLDKGETTSTNLSYVLQAAARDGRTSNIHCKYFSVTFYKKGTCHVKFHDKKIVDRLNIYVGRQRMWLPPSYGRTKYEEMDDESRRVVDEFQGQAQYETVTQCPADYIIEIKTVPLTLGAA